MLVNVTSTLYLTSGGMVVSSGARFLGSFNAMNFVTCIELSTRLRLDLGLYICIFFIGSCYSMDAVAVFLDGAIGCVQNPRETGKAEENGSQN